MLPEIEFPNVELWLCRYLRAGLPGDLYVTNRLALDERPAIVVRDESGNDSLVTAERRVTVRVFGSLEDEIETERLSREVARLLRCSASRDPESPAASGPVYGPYRAEADDPDEVEFLMTVELVVLGRTPEVPDAPIDQP